MAAAAVGVGGERSNGESIGSFSLPSQRKVVGL